MTEPKDVQMTDILVERLLEEMDASPVDAVTCINRAELTQLRDRIVALEADVARLREFIANPPKHKFWGAGEPDCPRELKAGNGELRTLRCKVCGEDNPRDSICRWAIGTRESDSDAAMRFIDKLRADYGTVTILPDNEEADTKAEQMAIDCCGEWTNWQDQRFYGETILQCLAKAVVVQEKARATLEARNG